MAAAYEVEFAGLVSMVRKKWGPPWGNGSP